MNGKSKAAGPGEPGGGGDVMRQSHSDSTTPGGPVQAPIIRNVPDLLALAHRRAVACGGRHVALYAGLRRWRGVDQ